MLTALPHGSPTPPVSDLSTGAPLRMGLVSTYPPTICGIATYTASLVAAVAAAAGLKTLEILRRPGTYERLFANGRKLMEGYADVIAYDHVLGAEAAIGGGCQDAGG